MAETFLHAKFHLNPSNRLATVDQRQRQTDRTDRQRTDSIGRTVLQTVAQKQHIQTSIIAKWDVYILQYILQVGLSIAYGLTVGLFEV